MVKLVDLVEVVSNDDEGVFLKVKPDKVMELQMLGFTGNETGFRVTKGRSHTLNKYFIVGGEPRSASCDWGYGGHTVISDSFEIQKRKVVECIERDLGIDIE